MRLARLRLRNYRRFTDFEIELDPYLTVIAARNGNGKTTVLEAIAAALGPFVGAFPEGRSEHIQRTDARFSPLGAGPENHQNFPVVIEAQLTGSDIPWRRELRGEKGRTTTAEAAPLADLAKNLRARIDAGDTVELPVICYYSSQRLWGHHRNTSKKGVLTQSRSAGYEDCLSAVSSYKQLQEWMRKATYADLQQKNQPGYEGSNLRARLDGIGDAVAAVMSPEGWSDFHYSMTFDELAMVYPDHGALPLSMLSDGVRAMIALTADLALRCTRLNSHLGRDAPQETDGIVLIDEIDLHLHPAWQQQVLEHLRQAFPRIQFIVSTHSPQVLSTVRAENIRAVFPDAEGHWHAERPELEIWGRASSAALGEIMSVDPIPQVAPARLLSDYIASVETGTHESTDARRLRDELDRIYGAGHPTLRDLDRLIRFQRIKSRQEGAQPKSRAEGVD